MKLLRFIKRLAGEVRGAVIVEFALLGPTLIVAMIGVFYCAVYLQNYNALRSVASDTARRVMVEYQKDNSLSISEIQAIARSIAVSSPYMLLTDQLSVNAVKESTSRVTDADEYTLTLNYTGVHFLPIEGLGATNMSYERPIFVVDES